MKLRALLLLLLPSAALALIATGVWLIYPPAAFIVVGVAILLDLSRKDKDSTP